MAYQFRAVDNIAGKVAPSVNFTGLNAMPTNADVGSAGAKKANAGDPWWMDALDTLSGVGKLVTQQTANWTDNQLNWNDIPLLPQVGQSA